MRCRRRSIARSPGSSSRRWASGSTSSRPSKRSTLHRGRKGRNCTSRMPIHQAIILGIVQGLAEFLPISSSAHLILVPWVLGWDDPGLAFDVALHWGTLFAVLFVFWRDWIRLIGAGVGSLRDRNFTGTADRKLFWALVLSAVPAAGGGKA